MKNRDNRRTDMKYMKILDEMSNKYRVNLHCKGIDEIKEILTKQEYETFMNQFSADMEEVKRESYLKADLQEDIGLIEFEDEFIDLLDRFSNIKQKDLIKCILYYGLSIAVEEYDKDSLDLVITRSMNDVLDLKMSEFRIINTNDTIH